MSRPVSGTAGSQRPSATPVGAGGAPRPGGSIRDLVVTALSTIRAVDVTTIHQEMAGGGGDLAMDSQEAVAVIARLESQLGRELPGAEDLEPDEIASVNALSALIESRL